MRISFVVTVFVALAACPASAYDGEQTLDSWVSGMLRRVPFKDGFFNHEALVKHSQGYLEGLITHYRTVGERPRRRAEEAGDVFRVHEIDDRTAKMIGEAETYVSSTTAGMTMTLDPEGTGKVTRKAARERLEQLAEKADSNRDGMLDRFEATIAEAAFAKGVDLGEPSAEIALQRELDLSLSYWEQ
ncbi:hypothetical protein G6L37_05165 [Agrobacterium rubi]|nr:hypothetical protein [Agrobacterium rubi]NTF24746.1 hypothetical protein [Agrobacterium rubi]